MAAQYYKINYKSDFVLTINSDAGWAVPFCIKFWTGMPSHGYFAGFDGENYVNCRVGETPTQLLVMFDDHHMPVGPLRMQIAYHTTIEEFPDRKFDEVTNPTNVTVDIDGTEYQVMLDFTGETGAEIDFSMPSSGVMSVNGKIGYVTLNAEDVGAQPTIEDLATIRSGAAAGATAVQPAEMTAALATKQDTINDLATIRSGAAAGATAVQPATLQEGLATKQDVISDLATIRSGAAAGATAVQPATLQEGLATKQDVISDLSTIRNGAAAGATAVQPAALTPIENDIDAIEGKIPSAASASNQLADKAFVNSALADKADTSDIPTALSQLSQDSTHRVVTDAEKSTWNGKQNSIDDLATIRSGAAAGATAVQPAAMNTALAAKQDTLTFDNTPTANSNNPVKSSGIKTALDAKQNTISTVNVSVDNNTGTPSGSASVSGSTLSLSFQNLKGATGATGATGPQGPQGERGLPGESGVTGDVSGFTVIQTIDPSATYGATDIAGAATVQATNQELTELSGNFPVKESEEVANSDLDITDESGYVLTRFENGHVKTKNFNSASIVESNMESSFVQSLKPIAVSDNLSPTDLDIADENGNILAKFQNGGIKTKNFDSSSIVEGNMDASFVQSLKSVEVYDNLTPTDLDIADENGNVIAKFESGHIKTKNFDSSTVAGYNGYNDITKNKEYMATVNYFIKNKVVNKQNRCPISFNGDSIFGSQLDDVEVSAEYLTGAFPPNMSKNIIARLFYDRYKFADEDTQFRNIIHSDWVKSGFNVSQKYKPTATEPYTSSDLLTFNEIETYGCNSTDDYAQITVTGYKWFKLVWSECSYGGWSFSVLVSVDGGSFITPSAAGLDLPNTVSNNIYDTNNHVMQRYAICELSESSTYIFKIVPVSSPNYITFWGCEFWNNPRLDVVVEAYSGSTAIQQVNKRLDSYYSDWHKPFLVIADILAINDRSYIWTSSETIEGWMKANATIYDLCRSNGIPILAFGTHVNNELNANVKSIARNYNLAFVDILAKKTIAPPSSSIVNNTDGLHLSTYGNEYYFEELKKIFD